MYVKYIIYKNIRNFHYLYFKQNRTDHKLADICYFFDIILDTTAFVLWLIENKGRTRRVVQVRSQTRFLFVHYAKTQYP